MNYMTSLEEQQVEKQPKTKKDIVKLIVEWMIYFVIIFSVSYLILNYVGQRTLVEGLSMTPTLHNGDSVVVDKLSYRFGEPQRFDIVVFRYLPKDETYYIKRIIGLPGETIQIIDGYVYINGEKLESDIYGNAVMLEPGRAKEPIILGEYEYFVLGDNRNGSSDSRMEKVGNVEVSQIVGKAFVRVWPLKDIGILRHQ
jgi:signal peptidase I